MVRVIIKGGVWRNTEDEILKAAISKYGKNQWARIASLLVRKTPKQCKARWTEWLDPSIKKVEWSKTEDEKLLHLAKLMPTQWRTIAPIVGRTANQCLERYQKLLDEAEARDNEELGLGGSGGPEGQPSTGGDNRGLRAGEVDVDQESKPARPDPMDMDEDEKEMLSEARARLANTQGKKAKRKARERQLEEARRLAALQKKRELKAAGIFVRAKPKKGGTDYNADIPFNKQPVPGFYDVNAEDNKRYSAPVGQSLRQLEGKRRVELEEQEEKRKRQKKDKTASGNNNTQFIAAREAQIQKLKEAEQIIRRRKLNLPMPQVGESELEDIVKIGRSGQNARDLVLGSAGASGEASDQLIGEYDPISKARMARTPRTAPQEDNVMNEARNLRNMTAQQTPLLGDENTPLHGPAGLGSSSGTGYEGATPRHVTAATPNPLATPFRRDDSATPRTQMGGDDSSTYSATPMRDNLHINAGGESNFGDTPRDQRLREVAAKRALQAGFANLPRPENNFEFDEPELEEEEEDEDEFLTEEDAADRAAKLQAQREEEERKALARRSQVVKLDLPRPVRVNLQRLVDGLAETHNLRSSELEDIDTMIDYELAQLMLHDAIAHPQPGTNIPPGTESQYEMPEDEYVAAARREIHAELGTALEAPGASETQLKNMISAMAIEDDNFMLNGWSAEKDGLVFSAASNMWVPRESTSSKDINAGLSQMADKLKERMIGESAKAVKAEKKLGKQLGGYQMINKRHQERIANAIRALESQRQDFETFNMLKTLEEGGAPHRLDTKREEVAKLERRERDLQSSYAELADERRELLAKIEQVSVFVISAFVG